MFSTIVTFLGLNLLVMGLTIYVLNKLKSEGVITDKRYSPPKIITRYLISFKDDIYGFDNMYYRVYATREEAEAKLKEFKDQGKVLTVLIQDK